MNDEIKEILDFKENADYKKLSCDEIAILKDYITNLQQENERLNQDLSFYQRYGADMLHKNNILEERIEKAVEYLDKHKIELSHSFDEPDCDYWIATNPQDIIDILNGKE